MRPELGVCVESGAIYENIRNYWFEVWPLPVISGAAFVEASAPAVQIIAPDKLGGMAFREDSFDATTRIRRGRLYKCAGNIIKETIQPHTGRSVPARGFGQVSLHRFDALQPKVTASLVAIGVEDSVWRILGAERISTGEWLVTLKARGGAGLLPEINSDAIPETGRSEVIKAVNHMVDVAHRETPGSIVDVARNTAPLLMTVYAAALESAPEEQRRIMEKDLGQICGHFRRKEGLKDRNVAIFTGDILARLHPRNRHNEKHRHDLRPLTEEDASFAVSAIGLLLNEFEWTQEAAGTASSVNDTVASH